MASTISVPRLCLRNHLAIHRQPFRSSGVRPAFLFPQRRTASGIAAGDRSKKVQEKATKKPRTDFIQYNLKHAVQFTLCDAMRYIRAFEVGQSPISSKYDLSVRLRTPKKSPTVKNRLRLPYPVNPAARIAVICPPNSVASAQAETAGACLVGEDNIIDAVKAGRIEFDRCLCHVDSVSKLNSAGLGKILGPKGLMPSVKLGTVVKDVAGSVRGTVGVSAYRERDAVIRMAVGQLGFTPEEMQTNIRAFMDGVKKDIAQLRDQVDKRIHEVPGSEFD